MERLSALLLILSLFLLASCQVKETLPSSGLISNHSPTVNRFTLSSLPTKTYVVDEIISFELTFPFEMTIGTSSGTPRVKITIGSTIRYATYVPQTDLKKLVFQYTVLSGDQDTDGVEFNALELNGSTLKFSLNDVLQDCDTSTLSSITLTSTKVDTTGPTVNSLSLVTGNYPRLHHLGDEIRFVVTYSEAVFVTGTPKFVLTLSSGTSIDVNFSAGSGTNTLVFSFSVGSNHVALSGYNSMSAAIALNGGTLKDAVGNNASLDLSSQTSAVLASSIFYPFDGEIPFVSSIIVPEDKTFVASESLDFILTFNREVTVTTSNKPYLALTIGTTTRRAQYYSGSGTRSIIFRYTLVPGDEDLDGIAVAATITQNSGNITGTAAPSKSFFFAPTNNALIVPSTKRILANAIQPRAISISRNTDSYLTTSTTDNTWIIGQNLDLTVGFNTKMFVTQTLGTPSLAITVGSTTRQATYLSGGDGQTSLIFRYTIQEGDLDSDGSLGLGSMSLNGGVITDEANTNSLLALPVSSLSSTKVDGVRPSVSSVTLPANGTYSTVAPLTSFEFILHWNEAVLLSTTTASATYLSLTLGSEVLNVNYASGHNSTSLTFRYNSSLAGKNDSDGITLGTTILGTSSLRDAAGNTVLLKTLPAFNTSGIIVDTTQPTIQSVSTTVGSGSYRAGTNLDFLFTFSEPVTLTSSGTYPNILLSLGVESKLLEAVTSGTSTTHTFRYTIQPGDTDVDSIAVTGNINQNVSGVITDSGRNSLNGSFTPPPTVGIMVDTEAPQIVSVTAPAQKTYAHPETIDLVLSFSENIMVDGTPRIPLTLGSGDAYFSYHSGSGTKDLTFRYSIGLHDFDFDGLPASIGSLELNGGSLGDVAGNPAPNSFTAQDLSGLLVTFPSTDLWLTKAFDNRSSNTSVTTTQTGDLLTVPCGSSDCRAFNDNDNVEVTSGLSNIITLYLLIKLPDDVSGDHEIFGSDIKLVEDLDSGSYDIYAPNAMVVIDGQTSVGSPDHNFDLSAGTLKLIKFHFSTPLALPLNQLLFGTSFIGAIGEIMAITDTVDAEQETAIVNYLTNKFQ